MKSLESIHRVLGRAKLVMLLLTLCAGWASAQTDSTQAAQQIPATGGMDNSSTVPETYNPDTSGDRMMTPPPVSGQTYPITLGSQERSNYLRAGVSFTSAYSDNVLGGVSGHPVSDISYSVAPVIGLDETTTRMHALLTYAPGFTFYQRTSDRNEADHNAAIEFEYRLSPHVTFSASDSFQKSSNVFNQPTDFAPGGIVSGGAQGPNFSIIAPVANRLSNFGSAGISYQFALNDMVGASGTFSNLHYPDQSQVPGLFDSSSQGGLAFYSHRVARSQYLGVTYAYERLLAYPTVGENKTETHAALAFYTFAPTSSKFSFSLFGGPQYSDTTQPAPLLPLKSWNPAGGASLGWQARLTSLALSYSHIISSAGGLVGAVQLDSATLSARQQITRTLNASLSGGYAQNNVIGSPALGAYSGHSISGSAFLQQLIGQHLSVQLGYTRVHQTYDKVEAISAAPDTNRESISIAYQFSRPLGR
jgi:hypothetical protein